MWSERNCSSFEMAPREFDTLPSRLIVRCSNYCATLSHTVRVQLTKITRFKGIALTTCSMRSLKPAIHMATFSRRQFVCRQIVDTTHRPTLYFLGDNLKKMWNYLLEKMEFSACQGTFSCHGVNKVEFNGMFVDYLRA